MAIIKKKTAVKKSAVKEKGQTLPTVLLLAGTLAIMSASLVFLFRYNQQFLVKGSCIMQKQEIASLALEQCIYKLEQNNNWYTFASTLPAYQNYSTQFTTSLGTYEIHIAQGNLFYTVLSDPTQPRQDINGSRTIGIKVMTTITACVGDFYAVIQKTGLGGPLISKGMIDTCYDTNGSDADPAEFFWGDIYSANTTDAYCGSGRYRLREEMWLTATSPGCRRFMPWVPFTPLFHTIPAGQAQRLFLARHTMT